MPSCTSTPCRSSRTNATPGDPTRRCSDLTDESSSAGRGCPRLVRPRPHGPSRRLAARRARRREGARGRRDLAGEGPRRRRLGAARRRRRSTTRSSATWAAKPLAEVRDAFARVAGELRGYLTVVPETRWVKNADKLRFFHDETLDHYDEHRADLAAILAAAGDDGRGGTVRSTRSSTEAAAELEAVERRGDAAGGAVEWSIGGVVFAAARRRTRGVPARPAGRRRGAPDSGHGAVAARRDWVAFAPRRLDRPRDRPGDGVVRERLAPRRRGVLTTSEPDMTRRRGAPREVAQPRRRGGGRWTFRLPPARNVHRRCETPYRARPRRAGLDQITPPSRRRLGSPGSGLGGLRVLGEPEVRLELLQRPEARRRPSAAGRAGRTRSSGCS